MSFCGKCGTKISDDKAFCTSCGNAVDKRFQEELDDSKTELLNEFDSDKQMIDKENSPVKDDEQQLNNRKPTFSIRKISKKAMIIFFSLLVAFIILGGFVFTRYTKAEKAEEAKKELNLGNKYLDENNYQEAILALNKVIEIDSKNTDVRVQLGKVYTMTGETEKAEKVLKEAINIDSKKVTAYSELANTYVASGKIKEAKEILEDGHEKTVDEELKTLLDEINQKKKVGEMKIGEYIQVASYLGKPLVWRVIDINSDGTPLLWLDNILCYKSFDAAESGKYGQEGGDLTNDKNRQRYGSSRWANSNLREWLNSSETKVKYTTQPPTKDAFSDNSYDDEAGFLTNFTKAEQNMIKEADIKTGLSEIDNGLSNVENEGKDYKSEIVKDKVFLLSYEEWSKFILGGIYKEEGTNFINQTAFSNGSGKYMNFNYWLRNAQFNGLKGGVYDGSYGYSPNIVQIIYSKFLYCALGDGKPFGVSAAGTIWGANTPNYDSYGVCPALYLKPETIIWSGEGTKTEPYMVNKISDKAKESYDKTEEDYDKIANEIDETIKNYGTLQVFSFSKQGDVYSDNYTVHRAGLKVCYVHYVEGDFSDYTFYYKDEKLIKVQVSSAKGDSYDYYFKDDKLILKNHYEVGNKFDSKEYSAVNRSNSQDETKLLNLNNKVFNDVKSYKGIENETGKP